MIPATIRAERDRHRLDTDFIATDCLDTDEVVIRYANGRVEKVDHQTYMIRYLVEDTFRQWYDENDDQWRLF